MILQFTNVSNLVLYMLNLHNVTRQWWRSRNKRKKNGCGSKAQLCSKGGCYPLFLGGHSRALLALLSPCLVVLGLGAAALCPWPHLAVSAAPLPSAPPPQGWLGPERTGSWVCLSLEPHPMAISFLSAFVVRRLTALLSPACHPLVFSWLRTQPTKKQIKRGCASLAPLSHSGSWVCAISLSVSLLLWPPLSSAAV